MTTDPRIVQAALQLAADGFESSVELFCSQPCKETFEIVGLEFINVEALATYLGESPMSYAAPLLRHVVVGDLESMVPRPVVDPSEGYTSGLMPHRSSFLWSVFKKTVKELRDSGIEPTWSVDPYDGVFRADPDASERMEAEFVRLARASLTSESWAADSGPGTEGVVPDAETPGLRACPSCGRRNRVPTGAARIRCGACGAVMSPTSA